MNHSRAVISVLVAIVLPLASGSRAEEGSDEILDIGHVEEVTSSLIQVPIIVAGSGDLYRLSADDLEVWIGDRRLEHFRVDYLGEATSVGSMRVTPRGKAPPGFKSEIRYERPTPPSARTVGVRSKCGNGKQVTLPARPARVQSSSSYNALPAAPVVPAATGSPLDHSVVSMVSINANDEPPSPALRIVSHNKFLRLGTADSDITEARSTRPVRTTVVPTGFDDGAFEAMVQVAVPDPGMAAATWDLVLSIASGRMTSVVWGRIEAVGNEDRLVLQDTLRIPPGGYTLVARAHNVETGETRVDRFVGTLEKPSKNRASVGPVAVFQPGGATILRAGHALSSVATIALGTDEPLAPDRESVLLASLCRDRTANGELTVDRSLIGSDEVSFPTTRIEPVADRCIWLADRVPADKLGQGHFLYRIRVSDSEGLLAEGQHDLFVH
jgi:hypothetical protein